MKKISWIATVTVVVLWTSSYAPFFETLFDTQSWASFVLLLRDATFFLGIILLVLSLILQYGHIYTDMRRRRHITKSRIQGESIILTLLVLALCIGVLQSNYGWPWDPKQNVAVNTEGSASDTADTATTDSTVVNQTKAGDKGATTKADQVQNTDSLMQTTIEMRLDEIADAEQKRNKDSLAKVDSVKQCGSAKALAQLQHKLDWFKTPIVVNDNCDEMVNEILKKSSNNLTRKVAAPNSKGGADSKFVVVNGSEGTANRNLNGGDPTPAGGKIRM